MPEAEALIHDEDCSCRGLICPAFEEGRNFSAWMDATPGHNFLSLGLSPLGSQANLRHDAKFP